MTVQNVSSSSNINFTDTTLLPSDWGPKRDPLYIVLPISIILISIFISGVVGNVSTCIVIARNKCMHTATNYYLFSLAISDLLLLVAGLPPEIYYIWSKYPYIFGEEFCVLQGFAAEASANATVLTITAFTIERYVAICYPFFSHTLSKLNRAIKYIIYIWIFAMCLAVPQALVFGIVCEVLNGEFVQEHCVCVPKRSIIPYAFEISTVVFFVAPMSLITVLYLLIGVQLQKSIRPDRTDSVRLKERIYRPVVNLGTNSYECEKALRECDAREEGRKTTSKNAYAAKHVIKMLVAVVVAFFICWAPFHAQRLLAIYGTPTSRPMRTAFQILTYVSGVLYYLSTTVNPLLYHIMSHKYREAFKSTYRQCCKKRQNLPGGKRYSSLSARSSQVNSHSTDSYSNPAGRNAFRFLEQEMAHIRDSKRPVVVSFKKKRHPITARYNNHEIQDTKGDYPTSSSTRFPTVSFTVANQHRDAFASTSRLETSYNANLDRTSRTSYTTSDIRFDTDRHISNFCSLGDNLKSDRRSYLELRKNYSFVEVNSLQPKHVCPMNKNRNFL